MSRFMVDDGGRAAAGFKGTARDCVVRAVSIATGLKYAYVHERFTALKAKQPKTSRSPKLDTGADNGVRTQRRWFRYFMRDNGWVWVPTIWVGCRTRTRLRAQDLPPGRLVVHVSRHCVAVVDGVIHDTHDPSRGGTRVVHGYWRKS